jgi:multicomponent Na+:H+ antiporter subunit E
MTSRDRPVRRFLLVFGISYILWLLLTASLTPDEMIAGLLVSLAAAIFTANRPSIFSGIYFRVSMPVHILSYLGVFLLALIRANLDMAARVLSPRMPLRPQMVQVSTALQSDLGKLVLANSITLTPGTLSVDIVDDLLLVHWIEAPDDVDIEAATHKIAAGFEKHLAGFLS